MPRVILEAELKQRTDKALRVVIDGKEDWLPLSQLKPLSQDQIDEHVNEDHADPQRWMVGQTPALAMVQIPEWLAIKKGWI